MTSAPISPRQFQVACIDDDALEHDLLARLVRRETHIELRPYFDVAEAAQALARSPVDLILLDARIPPDNDPVASVALLRSHGTLTRIIVMSSVLDPARAGNETDVVYMEKDQITRAFLVNTLSEAS
ncbi:hypothetical protein [uncultured Tateyamaria sp.]|uniref:hypothetical protein n=1 Tax=uncultured Tateyamaria sp. TaxID=455651 RepID=UPI002601AE47|nr:hypothetical protein [uncultured Tateyamaria sp.]